MSKILIVDDSPFMRAALSDMLKSHGFEELLFAENGREAIDMFASENPDLVLLDILMPDIDGMDVLKEIVPLGARVLMVTQVAHQKSIARAQEIGALGYVIKPFEETEVIEEIRKVLRGSGVKGTEE